MATFYSRGPLVMHDAADLTSESAGAVVVYGPASRAGCAVVLVPVRGGPASETVLIEREIKGRTFHCAVFDHCAVREYRVLWVTADRQATVRVAAGRVTQVDWRRDGA
jgi:hypothetical protein